MADIKSLCVYCGSSERGRESHRESAKELGVRMAKAGIRLVYGAGGSG